MTESRRNELLNIINDKKPRIVALQDIMMQETKEMRIPHYNIIKRAAHFNWRSHGGVMLIIHESVPMTEINVQTEAQVVEARLDIYGCFTVASAYFSKSRRFLYEILSNIIVQLPQPFLLLGDFNGHHRKWGSDRVCTSGQIVERILADISISTY